MKIITENKAYVQKNDIAYLNQSDLPIPASIFMKVFGNGITIIDNSNRYEFVEFSDPNEIEFFKNLDWIIDYNGVKNLTDKELIALGQAAVEEQNGIATRFNALSIEERRQNHSMVTRCELLEFKVYSLKDIYWFKQGKLKIELPKGIDSPTNSKEEKGIKRLFKSIFNKGKAQN